MRKWIFVLFVATLGALPIVGYADNLAEAYRQAVGSDPTFKAQTAAFEAAQQLTPIARSYLLPSLTTNGTAGRGYVKQTFDGVTTSFYQDSEQYALNLNQVIFNYQVWSSLKNAKAQVKQAEATYNANAQDLILRVATAYLAVLQAYDQLQATQAQKLSLAQQLKQTQDQFDVGLIPITGLEQVKASYDTTIALEIANKNTIAEKLEDLRAITGVFYTTLHGINTKLPLISPRPDDINAWVDIATKQSYAVKAAYYAMVAARQNVNTQRAGHFPTLSAVGNYTYTNQSASLDGGVTAVSPFINRNASVGVGVNFPVYQGGLVNAQTQQAASLYAEASAQLEETYRSTLAQTREAYLGVISGISKLKADRQAITSSQSSLNSTKSGYTAGTQTIVDVLQQQSDLYTAQTNYANDQYNYLVSLLTLKQAAGTLSPQDILMVNSWLTKPIDFSAYNFNTHQINYSSIDTIPAAHTTKHHSKKKAKTKH